MPVSTDIGQVRVEHYSRTAFKAKTDKHRVREQGKPATLREALPESAAELIDTFVSLISSEPTSMIRCNFFHVAFLDVDPGA